MKKITFAIAAMAMFAFAACTNNSTNTTSEDSAKQAQAYADSIAKLPVVLTPDSPAVKTVDSPAVKVEVKK